MSHDNFDLLAEGITTFVKGKVTAVCIRVDIRDPDESAFGPVSDVPIRTQTAVTRIFATIC
jgi:hypothetical protein